MYIKENFKKIMGNIIPDKELDILKPLLSNLKNNQAVKCIYLVPIYNEKEFGREPFEYFYKKFYIRVNKEKITAEEYEQMIICINKARFSLKEKGYFFIDAYQFNIIEKFNEWYWRSLVSSYIIFDRNGTYEKLQDELKTQVEPYKAISQYYLYGLPAEIENIDELNDEPVKKKVLNRNNN